MAKSFQCAHLGMVDCPGMFKVDTEEELLAHVALHAQKVHPEVEMTPELVEQTKSLIKTS